MRPTTIAFTLLLATCSASTALADVIHLKNGRLIEGKVVERSHQRVRMKTGSGTIELPMYVVLRIDACDTPGEELGDRAAATDMTDPAAIESLALWASARGLGDEGRDLLALSRGLRLELMVARAQAVDQAAEFLAVFHWARVNEASDEVLDWLLAEARNRAGEGDPAVQAAYRARRSDVEERQRAEARRQEILSRPRYLDPEQEKRMEAAMGQNVTLTVAQRRAQGDPRRGAAILEQARAARRAASAETTPAPAAPSAPAAHAAPPSSAPR